MDAALNVNLERCTCPPGWPAASGNHFPGSGTANNPACPATPVLVPCRVPTSATFTVRLGQCTARTEDHCGGPCVCSPIRVVCSIRGKTWKESEVEDAERTDRAAWRPSTESNESQQVLWACRERWAMVKALVTGQPWTGVEASALDVRWRPLFANRDAVFAALADMVRAEEAMLSAQTRAVAAIGSPRLTTGALGPEARPSAQALAVYVESLVEQVGALS